MKPTASQVRRYFMTKKVTGWREFFDYYEARNWVNKAGKHWKEMANYWISAHKN